jgi:hypothetical protein
MQKITFSKTSRYQEVGLVNRSWCIGGRSIREAVGGASGFFIPEILVRLRWIDQGSGWWCITVGLRYRFLR